MFFYSNVLKSHHKFQWQKTTEAFLSSRVASWSLANVNTLLKIGLCLYFLLAWLEVVAFCFGPSLDLLWMPLGNSGVGWFALLIHTSFFSSFAHANSIRRVSAAESHDRVRYAQCPHEASYHFLPTSSGLCPSDNPSERKRAEEVWERESGTLSEMNRGRARCSVPLACFAACGQSAQLECTFVVHPVCYFQLFLMAPVSLAWHKKNNSPVMVWLWMQLIISTSQRSSGDIFCFSPNPVT